MLHQQKEFTGFQRPKAIWLRTHRQRPVGLFESQSRSKTFKRTEKASFQLADLQAFMLEYHKVYGVTSSGPKEGVGCSTGTSLTTGRLKVPDAVRTSAERAMASAP